MTDRKTPTSLADSAIKAEQEGRPAKACQLLRMALANHPRPAEIHLRLGRILAARGRHQEALEALVEAAKHGADAAEIDQARGASLLALGKHEEAREAFDRARQQRPDFAAAHLGAGRASEALEDFDQAAVCYRAATGSAPQDPEAWRLLASVLRRKGEHDAAAEALARAVQSPHGSLFVWGRQLSAIGEEVRELLKQSDPAQPIIDCLQHALEATSTPPDQATLSWLTWAETLIGAGRRDLALQTYSVALRELPRAAAPRVAFGLGYSLANFAVTDDKPEVRAQEIEAALGESSAPAAWTSWWSSLHELPDTPPHLRERAVDELLKLLEEKPEQRGVDGFLWNAANEEALVQRIGEIAEHWDSSEARLTWAEALLAAGRVKSAVQELERIDESLSRDERLRWAKALFNGGLPKEALRQLRRCLEGGDVAAGLGEAWWLDSVLKSAVDLGPEISAIRALVERCGDPAAMARFAKLLAACERDDEAEGLAQAALTLDPDAPGPYAVLETCWKRRRPSASKRRPMVDLIEERGGLAGALQAGKLLHALKDDAADRLLRRAAEGYEAEAGKLRADAEVAEHLLKAADAWLELKDFDHAFGAFERAAEFDPDRYAIYESWTRSFGRFDEELGLIATLRRELGLARLSRDFDENCREQRPFSEAHADGVRRLVEGIRRDCDRHAIAYLANQLLRQRRTGAALDAFRHACRLFPSDAGAARDLGTALFNCGRFAEAFAQQAEAATLHAQAATSLDDDDALHLRLQISRAQAEAAGVLAQLQEACSILEEGLAGLLPAPGSPLASAVAETYIDLAGYFERTRELRESPRQGRGRAKTPARRS